MMNFFKKNLPFSEVLQEMTDCHSHILPGVDDGIKSEKDACATLEYLKSLGVKKVTLTPHIMEEYPLNS